MHSRQTTLRYFLSPLLLIVCISLVCSDTSPAAQTKIWEELSGEKAFAHVQQLVDFGPRPSGSEAIEKSRRPLALRVRAADRRLCAEQLEVIRRGAEQLDARDAISPRERRAGANEPGDIGEDARSIAEIIHLRDRHANVFRPGAAQIVEHAHKAIGIMEGKRLQQHRVDDREDREIGADAERERQHGDDHEQRRSRQRPHGVADVL